MSTCEGYRHHQRLSFSTKSLLSIRILSPSFFQVIFLNSIQRSLYYGQVSIFLGSREATSLRITNPPSFPTLSYIVRAQDAGSAKLFSPPPGLAVLRDLALSPEHCVAVWSVEGEAVVTSYGLRDGAPALGRRMRLSHFDWLRDLREEDSALLIALANSSEETVTESKERLSLPLY